MIHRYPRGVAALAGWLLALLVGVALPALAPFLLVATMVTAAVALAMEGWTHAAHVARRLH